MKLLMEKWRKYITQDGDRTLTHLVNEDDDTEEDVEEGRDFQKDSSYIKDHEGNKEELIGDGGQDNSEPYEKNPIKKRSKSAPPAG